MDEGDRYDEQCPFCNGKLTDTPTPSTATASAFKAAGYPSWVYFCHGPRDKYMQNFLDTPLDKIRMSG